MSKHTPGPWQIGGRTILRPTLTIFHIPFGLGDVAEVYEEADAILIAAAPELLEALRMFVVWYGLRDKHDTLLPPKEQEAELAQAMRAIAKATGAPE